jgi:hypothetical protein
MQGTHAVQPETDADACTQRMVIYQMADWDKFKAAAKRALEIPFDHPELDEMSAEPP